MLEWLIPWTRSTRGASTRRRPHAAATEQRSVLQHQIPNTLHVILPQFGFHIRDIGDGHRDHDRSEAAAVDVCVAHSIMPEAVTREPATSKRHLGAAREYESTRAREHSSEAEPSIHHHLPCSVANHTASSSQAHPMPRRAIRVGTPLRPRISLQTASCCV